MFLSPGSRGRSRLQSLWKAIGKNIYFLGGNVGIGTNTPTNGKLVIPGSLVTVNQGIRLLGDTLDFRMVAESATTGKGWLGTFSGHDLSLYTNSVARLNISQVTGLLQLTAYGAGTLVSDGSGNITTRATVATVKVQTFTSSGTYTPSTGMLFCIIECIGGGGGGGGINSGAGGASYGAGGGGSGGYSRTYSTAASIGASQAVTIGALGAGGVTATGSAGGTTSVGALCAANGGLGGGVSSGGVVGGGGNGGNTSGAIGDIVGGGEPGGNPVYLQAANLSVPSGQGGSSVLGGGAGPAFNAAGNAALNYGSGGSGAAQQNALVNRTGGDGSKGVVVITEFCSQ